MNTTTPEPAGPVYICDVCEDELCGHCTGCTCPDCRAAAIAKEA